MGGTHSIIVRYGVKGCVVVGGFAVYCWWIAWGKGMCCCRVLQYVQVDLQVECIVVL